MLLLCSLPPAAIILLSHFVCLSEKQREKGRAPKDDDDSNLVRKGKDGNRMYDADPELGAACLPRQFFYCFYNFYSCILFPLFL